MVMKMKKIFILQKDLTSYKYPLIKIIVSLGVVLFSIFRNYIIVIPAGILNFIVVFICLTAMLAAVLCIYIAVGELFYVRENKKKVKRKASLVSTVPFSLERVIALAKECHIIEFEICANENLLKIGASSDNKYASSVFFNKRFYIENDEYFTADAFEKALFEYSSDGKINVVSIDGTEAKKW